MNPQLHRAEAGTAKRCSVVGAGAGSRRLRPRSGVFAQVEAAGKLRLATNLSATVSGVIKSQRISLRETCEAVWLPLAEVTLARRCCITLGITPDTRLIMVYRDRNIHPVLPATLQLNNHSIIE
jgi:hypothetical protein